MADARKRGPGRPRSVDRQAILTAAVEHYWRAGPSAVSLNELCRLTGISKSALYREFGSEDGLLLASLEHYREQIMVPRQAALDTDRPFGEVLDAAITALTSDLGTPPGCLFTRLRMARDRLSDEVKARVEELEQEQRDVFEAWFQGALARGEANAALPAELAVALIDTQFATILTLFALGEPPERIRAVARLALAALTDG